MTVPLASEASPPAVRQPWVWVVLLVVFGLGLNWVNLGVMPLGSHEALAGERARETVAFGHWVVPHLNGVPDATKPVMPFWITGGLSLLAGGFNECVVRAPSGVAAVGLAVLLVAWVRRLRGWRAALLTGFVALTSGGLLGWGRRGEVDMQVAFWTTVTLISYWLVITEERLGRRLLFILLMSLGLAAGVLTKGPLAPAALVVAALVTAVAGQGRQRGLRVLWPVVIGGAVSLALVAPWALWMMKVQPNALQVWFDQYIGRAGGTIGHDKPWYFYLTQTPLLWLPWVAFVILGLVLVPRQKLLSRSLVVFLLAWGVGGLVLLSLSVGKRLHYALGVQPPFLIFAGLALDYLIFEAESRTKWLVGGLHALAAPGILIGGLVAAVLIPPLRTDFILIAVVGGAGLAAAFWLAAKGRVAVALAVIGLLMFGGMAAYTGKMAAYFDRFDNHHEVGRYLGSRTTADQAVYCYLMAEPIEIFYAGRVLPVVGQDELPAWRKGHPGGYLIVSGGCLKEVQQAGPWEIVIEPAEKAEGKKGESQSYLLRAPAQAAAR